MNRYAIVNEETDNCLGLYYGETEQAALEAYAHDAGYASFAAAMAAIPDETPPVAREVDDKQVALASFLEVGAHTIEEECNGNWYTCTEEAGKWRVLTDSEADDAWNEYQDSLIDETLLADLRRLPVEHQSTVETLQRYFDRDAYKRDVEINDGRSALASYDDAEQEAKIDGEWYFIYRVG